MWNLENFKKAVESDVEKWVKNWETASETQKVLNKIIRSTGLLFEEVRLKWEDLINFSYSLDKKERWNMAKKESFTDEKIRERLLDLLDFKQTFWHEEDLEEFEDVLKN